MHKKRAGEGDFFWRGGLDRSYIKGEYRTGERARKDEGGVSEQEANHNRTAAVKFGVRAIPTGKASF